MKDRLRRPLRIARSLPVVGNSFRKPDLGRGLGPGAAHYRAYVGPPEDYDLIGGIQVGLLLAAGLRERHILADLGCGSLRAGRLLIPYLAPGHYFGLEPNRWLIEEAATRELGADLFRQRKPVFLHTNDFGLYRFGVEFDYVLAQSIFSHTFPDLLMTALRRVEEALAPGGFLLATYFDGEGPRERSGWLYPGCVTYTWAELCEILDRCGLAGYPIDWPHPYQQWFLAARHIDGAAAAALATAIRSPRADALRRVGQAVGPTRIEPDPGVGVQ